MSCRGSSISCLVRRQRLWLMLAALFAATSSMCKRTLDHGKFLSASHPEVFQGAEIAIPTTVSLEKRSKSQAKSTRPLKSGTNLVTIQFFKGSSLTERRANKGHLQWFFPKNVRLQATTSGLTDQHYLSSLSRHRKLHLFPLVYSIQTDHSTVENERTS